MKQVVVLLGVPCGELWSDIFSPYGLYSAALAEQCRALSRTTRLIICSAGKPCPCALQLWDDQIGNHEYENDRIVFINPPLHLTQETRAGVCALFIQCALRIQLIIKGGIEPSER